MISPAIAHFKVNTGLEYALLNLQEFAKFFHLTDKRTIEKRASLHVIQKVLKDESIEIFYEESGKPYLKEAGHISISHSHDWLAVLFSEENKAGIDIEKVRPKILNIKEKYLSAKELNELKEATLEAYTVYWAAKESIYKAFGISGLLFAEQIFIEPFEFSKNGGKITALVNYDNSIKNVILHYQVLGEYILVYTTDIE